MDLAVQRLRQDIQAGIHPTAARERLEPQPVPAAGHHRVTQPGPLRLVVARLGDVGHRQQPGRGLLGPGQEPGEEPRVGRRPGHRDPTRGLQHRPPTGRVGPRPRQIRVGMGCFCHAQSLQITPDSQRARQGPFGGRTDGVGATSRRGQRPCARSHNVAPGRLHGLVDHRQQLGQEPVGQGPADDAVQVVQPIPQDGRPDRRRQDRRVRPPANGARA
jgi:hypothetical protein